jgi:selenocysteine lyase/cysteine desulfurase
MRTYEFGTEIRRIQFDHHDPNVIRLNNGSFGSCPKDIQAVRDHLYREWTRNPDDFWHSLPQRFKDASSAIADRLLGGARWEDIVMVDNLTVAHSIVVHSIVANLSDNAEVVLLSNWTYGSIVKAIHHGVDLAKHRSGGTSIDVVEVSIPFPILSDDHADIIVGAYRSTLEQVRANGKRVALGLLDHVTSVPAMRMPIERLVALFREYDVKEVRYS